MAFPSMDSSHELFQGIALEVRAELGRKTMEVSEVLTLGVGSVIELAKQANEPLDVRINDRKIALAEAVVVGDTCGLRVQEVLGQQQSGPSPFTSFPSEPVAPEPPPSEPEDNFQEYTTPIPEDEPEPEPSDGPDLEGVCELWNHHMAQAQPDMTELLSSFMPRWKLAPISGSTASGQMPYFLLEDLRAEPETARYFVVPQLNISYGMISDLFEVVDEAGVGPGTGLVLELLSPATFIEEDPEAFQEIQAEHILPEAMHMGSVKVG